MKLGTIILEGLYLVPNPEDYEAEIESLDGRAVESYEDEYGELDLPEHYLPEDYIHGRCVCIRTRQPLTTWPGSLCWDVTLRLGSIAAVSVDEARANNLAHERGVDPPPYYLHDRNGNVWGVEKEVYDLVISSEWGSDLREENKKQQV